MNPCLMLLFPWRPVLTLSVLPGSKGQWCRRAFSACRASMRKMMNAVNGGTKSSQLSVKYQRHLTRFRVLWTTLPLILLLARKKIAHLQQMKKFACHDIQWLPQSGIGAVVRCIRFTAVWWGPLISTAFVSWSTGSAPASCIRCATSHFGCVYWATVPPREQACSVDHTGPDALLLQWWPHPPRSVPSGGTSALSVFEGGKEMLMCTVMMGSWLLRPSCNWLAERGDNLLLDARVHMAYCCIV